MISNRDFLLEFIGVPCDFHRDEFTRLQVIHLNLKGMRGFFEIQGPKGQDIKKRSRNNAQYWETRAGPGHPRPPFAGLIKTNSSYSLFFEGKFSWFRLSWDCWFSGSWRGGLPLRFTGMPLSQGARALKSKAPGPGQDIKAGPEPVPNIPG